MSRRKTNPLAPQPETTFVARRGESYTRLPSLGEMDFPVMPLFRADASRIHSGGRLPPSGRLARSGGHSSLRRALSPRESRRDQLGGVPVQEIGLVAAVAVAVFLLLAIVSYSAMDPAWTFAGTNLSVSNWVGQSGAYTADISLFTFGWAAYLFPAGIAVAAILLLRPGRRVERPSAEAWSWAAVRIGGFAAAVASVCVLLSLHVASGGALRAGSGGALGDSVARLGLPLLNPAGLTLCALAALMIGTQAAIGYSWLRLAEWTGRALHALAKAMWRLARRSGVLAGRGAGALARSLPRARQAEPETPPQAAQIDAPIVDAPVLGRGSAVADSPRPAAEKTQPVEPAVGVAPVETVAPHTTTPQTPAGLSLDVSKPHSAKAEAKAADPSETVGFPTLDLLEEYDRLATGGYSREWLEAMSRLLEEKLADFKVQADVVSVQPGPVVTRFELQPAAGVKVSKITGLAKDLARSLAVVSVRIVEIIPGKSVVGIEIPNEKRETVRLKEILSSRQFDNADSPLTLALGKDIAGVPVMSDIGRMPHLLVAGTTGSGKSVGINAMLLSMLYKAPPDELRLILVDPKMLELAVYDGIPHLLTPVVTDMKDAAQALNWCVAEMERRYQLMATLGVRNIGGFNKRLAAGREKGQPIADPLWPKDAEPPAPELERLPYIVVVIDEFADMMMIVGKKVEQLIARIAQKARAAGIHLVLATQRPSVDVITGLIKANIPARLSFQVSSRIDSRTILDQGGAEQLLGHGDMLFLPPGTSVPERVHGAFVSDEEVHAVAADWKARAQPDYLAEVVAGDVDTDIPGTVDFSDDGKGHGSDSKEPLYDEAVAFVLESRRASISSVQRKLRIGYNRAARLIEAMEEAGLVSAMDSQGSREVLAKRGPQTLEAS